MESSAKEQILKQELQDKNPHKMENLSQLPTLGDRRLAVVHKKVSKCRKNTLVQNEKIKMRSEVDIKSLNRYRHSEEFLGWQRSLPVKRSLLEIRGLQKCLRRKRENTDLNRQQTQIFGSYEGESVVSFRDQIENLIYQCHPRQRRLKKVDQMKQEGKGDGRLVDYQQSMSKFKKVIDDHRDFLRHSFAQLRERSRERERGYSPYFTKRRDPFSLTGSFRLPEIGVSHGLVSVSSRQRTATVIGPLAELSAHTHKLKHGDVDLEPVVPRADTNLLTS